MPLGCRILWYKVLWSFRYSLCISKWFGASAFHKASLAYKIDGNPGELLLENFQVCWVAESLFGGREMQQWNGSWPPYCLCSLLGPLHGSEAQSSWLSSCSLHFLLFQKPGNLRSSRFLFSRAAICLNLVYQVSYFSFFSLRIWFFISFKQPHSWICDCNFPRTT